MKITQLTPDPKNANRGTDRGARMLAQSLEEFGTGRSILVDRKGRVIAGNKTLEQAKAAGHTDVVVVKTDGTKLVAVQRMDLDLVKDKKARALAIADNRVSEVDLRWDDDLVAELGKDVDLSAFWSADELSRILEGREPEQKDQKVTDTRALELAKKWKTKAGQLWTCAGHRFLCGDSSNGRDVKRLLNGQKAHLVNTDPPYGVSDASAAGSVPGDNKRGDALLSMLTKSLGLAVEHSQDTAPFYVWHASASRRDFEAALEYVGLEEKQYITWFKDSFVMGRADYHWQTEPCFYCQKVGQSAPFYGDRTQSTLWTLSPHTGADSTRHMALVNGVRVTDGKGHELYVSVKAPKKRIRLVRLAAKQSLHLVHPGENSDAWMVSHDKSARNGCPTPKPIELGVRAIENSTLQGELVYDPFLGGGFTAIAAARTGRLCYGMELDPRYLAVTLEGLSSEGLTPKLEG